MALLVCDSLHRPSTQQHDADYKYKCYNKKLVFPVSSYN